MKKVNIPWIGHGLWKHTKWRDQDECYEHGRKVLEVGRSRISHDLLHNVVSLRIHCDPVTGSCGYYVLKHFIKTV